MYPFKKLGDICDILDNKRKPVTQSDRIPGPYPYYGATGILDHVSEYIFDEKLILIGEDGAKWGSGENTAFTAEGKYWVNNHAHVIRSHRDIVCDDWIIYFLNITDLLGHVTGVTVPKLNQGKLREILIPLPPLSTQLDIVAHLDSAMAEIEAMRAETESALASTRELWESTLENVFASEGKDWEEKTLDRIGANLDNQRRPITKNARTSGEFPYYGASGIVDYVADYIFDDILLLISEDGANLLARSTPIAFTAKGKFWVNNHAHILKFDNPITHKFVELYLNSISLDEYITGAAQPKLNQSQLNSIPIPFPPLPEQSSIVAHLDAIRAETERLESLYNEKLASLDELRRSVLAEAFL